MPEIPVAGGSVGNLKSIITLLVFLLTCINVSHPFQLRVPIPQRLADIIPSTLIRLRIIPPKDRLCENENTRNDRNTDRFVWLEFPMNYVTAPLIADIFLLAISAIGRQEIHDGSIGDGDINLLDIMVFSTALAYIGTSIDASGLIQRLVLAMMRGAGDRRGWLFLYLYWYYLVLGAFIGNDPIALSGTAAFSAIPRELGNMLHPCHWVYIQFAASNIGSAILVTSNPINMVLVGAIGMKFVPFSVNMGIAVFVGALATYLIHLWGNRVLRQRQVLPDLLVWLEPREPLSGVELKDPVNPYIPYVVGVLTHDTSLAKDEQEGRMPFQGLINPFFDKWGAGIGVSMMAVTVTTVYIFNTYSTTLGEYPVSFIALPAATVVFCRDLTFGWWHRKENRALSRKGKYQLELSRLERPNLVQSSLALPLSDQQERHPLSQYTESGRPSDASSIDLEESGCPHAEPTTLLSLSKNTYMWSRETFPTATAVLAHLPLAHVPFVLAMFVLVQALVTTGWVEIFASWWDVLFAVENLPAMVFGLTTLLVIFCNIFGTNFTMALLLCRVLQAWFDIHDQREVPIETERFWVAFLTVVVAVNYSAFSHSYSSSLPGMRWRCILATKQVHIPWYRFAIGNCFTCFSASLLGIVITWLRLDAWLHGYA